MTEHFRKLEDETFIMTREQAIDQIIAVYGLHAVSRDADLDIDHFRQALSALRAMGATQQDINAWSLRDNIECVDDIWVDG